MNIEEKIKELGITLPKSASPKAMYVPVKQIGNALFISGQGPFINDELVYTGKVGRERTLEEAQYAAKLCIVNVLKAVKDYVGNLDSVLNVVKLQAFVNSEEGFDQQHVVVNTASELLYGIFGDNGRHARTAVGVNQLPLNMTVEIEAIFEIKNSI
ncbi:hypothetical protein COJ92_27375 [Priestia megaterium]|uniref:RidA family protein n=1 Tax=Priestia megaterium TaxID=1404 RepID=UPI000BF3A9E2|nr:RidA family protein [Priestia megaterium]MDP1442285.1 RidA family protein [Priestia megaterium]MDP1471303.1 RidA family protein [Priestia megaterium]PFP10093.1 hypothetical protein COJ92_27375 [Priestia megaterium]PFU63294.1 hypothetical protein COK90_09775 [Priestia megaterium]